MYSQTGNETSILLYMHYGVYNSAISAMYVGVGHVSGVSSACINTDSSSCLMCCHTRMQYHKSHTLQSHDILPSHVTFSPGTLYWHRVNQPLHKTWEAMHGDLQTKQDMTSSQFSTMSHIDNRKWFKIFDNFDN